MKPSKLFLDLLEFGGVPHGHEQKYASLLERYGFQQDQFGNWYKVGQVPVLITAHLDTVNKRPGPIQYQVRHNYVYASGDEPLGADDRAGVALVLYMSTIRPDLSYALFIGEEVGMVGSRQAAQAYAQGQWVFQDLAAVVSLDRKGHTDIIITQAGAPCASIEFAKALQDQIPILTSLEHGVYTDSYAFVGLVPNATNLSVGYFNAHSPKESQDLAFLDRLGEYLIMADWNHLAEVSRTHPVDPSEVVFRPRKGYNTIAPPWVFEDYSYSTEELAQKLYDRLVTDPAFMVEFVYTIAEDYPEWLSDMLDLSL